MRLMGTTMSKQRGGEVEGHWLILNDEMAPNGPSPCQDQKKEGKSFQPVLKAYERKVPYDQ